MRVHVKLSTTLRNYIEGYRPEEGLYWEIVEEGTVLSLVEQLGLPFEDIKIVMINGRHCSIHDVLRDGDRVAFFPAVGGG